MYSQAKRRSSANAGLTASGSAIADGDLQARLPFLATLAIVLMLIPAYFFIGSLKLSPSKLLFLCVVPPLTIKLFRGAYGKLMAADFLVFGYAAWMTLAMLANHTARVAIEYTGSNTVTLLGGYLVARASIRSKGEFIALIRFLAMIVVMTLPFALYETVTSKTTIPRWLAAIPGVHSHNDINHDPRMGLWRAQVVFPHPIHYGIFCSLAFSLMYVGLRHTIGGFRRTVTSGVIGLCCFLSVSSGPFLALMCQVGLILWARAMKWAQRPWLVFGILFAVIYVILEIASGRPAIYAIVSRLSFSPGTAHSRLVLFGYGMEQIYRTPLLGVGYNPWPLPAWMTGSMDNFWLFLAVTFGVPTFLMFAGAYVFSMITIGRRNFRGDSELESLRLGWVFTMVSICLVLATVAIWGEAYSLILFMLGSGMWMAGVQLRNSAPVEQGLSQAPRRLMRTSGRRRGAGRFA